MNKIKRWVALLLSLCMIFSLGSFSVWAEPETDTDAQQTEAIPAEPEGATRKVPFSRELLRSFDFAAMPVYSLSSFVTPDAEIICASLSIFSCMPVSTKEIMLSSANRIPQIRAISSWRLRTEKTISNV